MIAPAAAVAEKRIALVIGNGAYEATSPLVNPPNDARLMTKTLEGLGFEVVSAVDADRTKMLRSIQEFGRRLKTHGKDAIGLFYYAGHGVQVKGRNYLLPVDSLIEDEGDVDIHGVTAGSILSRMEFSGARLNFVILDACRNNPFRGFSRSAERGLARMDAPAGSLVAYATSPGDVAADGTGRNSPYTAALARNMKKPGLTVEQMFRRVRNLVIEKTNEDQTPWESSSLTGDDFFFAGGTATATTVEPSAAPSVQDTTGQQADLVFWQSIQNSDNPVMFEAYLQAYPDGAFAPIAEVRLQELTGGTQTAAIDPVPDEPPASTGRALVTECDRLGAHPHDKQRVADGVAYGNLNVTAGAAACEAAVQQYPNEPRFKYQLARHMTDLKRGYELYLEAAQSGYAAAWESLGNMAENGEYIDKDFRKAMEFHRKAADAGNAAGQHAVGVLYDFGDGVAQNTREAMYWYRKAAEQGHAEAQNNLAWNYMNAEGIQNDPYEAAFWYRKSAEAGYVGAQYSLGVLYLDGMGVTKDKQRAFQWWRKAAEAGDEQSIEALKEHGG